LHLEVLVGVTSIRLSSEIEAPLEELAEKLDRSKNYLINQAIREFVARQTMEDARWADTLLALQSVKAGNTIDEEEVTPGCGAGAEKVRSNPLNLEEEITASPAHRAQATPADLDSHEQWDDYTDAWNDMLGRTNSVCSPWLVIPADNKHAAGVSVLTWLVIILGERLQLYG
ncbi:MAG: ribbon-helix-helix protein, CopG family, partial [Gammaproteobacteria bacterium]|nr:ribbon-helix-helix protein, CopG family [Gammaproteobacteria bacterium]